MRYRFNILIQSVIFITVIGILITACKKDEPEAMIPTSIELVSGENQQSEIETELTDPIIVVVKDQNGNAVSGRVVNFSVKEGFVSSPVVITDDEGRAGVLWTTGSTIGTQTLTVTAFEAGGLTTLSGSPFTVNVATSLTVTDYDGNVYKGIQIGSQVWMTENLKTTHYSDGTPIPFVTDNTTWMETLLSAYCWYDNDEATNKNTYGALYNWQTVNSGKLCPEGWRVPTETEWKTLVEYLGGEAIAGGKLKETGTDHWYAPNTGASNETGFTALPGGYRLWSGNFSSVKELGVWWSYTEYAPNFAYHRIIYYNYSQCTTFEDPYLQVIYGLSVRCIRD